MIVLPEKRKKPARPSGGTRWLLISCFRPGEPQYRGIAELLERLNGRPGFRHLSWNAGSRRPALDLRRRELLRWVLVCGHGAADQPRLGSGEDLPLTAADLRLPAASALYIASCFQGREDLRRAWARGCRIPAERVFGCPTETDSFLSTCLLLHLLEEGPAALPRRFAEWRAANLLLEPRFARLRAAYRDCGGETTAFLSAAATLADLAPAESFLAVARRHPALLSRLID